jgi:hypothetical protein
MRKMNKLFLILTLTLVVLVSGCTSFPNIFGPTTNTTVKELPPDVMVIQNVQVLPKASVRPSDQFSVYYEVNNQDDQQVVSGVKQHLYDTGLCELIAWPDCPNGASNSETCKPTYQNTPLSDFSPTETKMIEWTFNAPFENRIAGLSVKCPISFKISYDYSAKSQVDVLVVNSDRLTEMQRSGEDVTYIPTVNAGRGPLKIYFDFGNALPVKESSSLSVYIKVKNVGTGLYEQIPTGDASKELTIMAPDFQSLTCPPDYFSCSGTTCMNNKSIPLIEKQTFEIKCLAKTPAVPSMERTVYITAGFNYSYDVYGQASVEVSP